LIIFRINVPEDAPDTVPNFDALLLPEKKQ